MLYFLGAGGENDGQPLVLKEQFSNEGDAMVESLKRDVPYYRVEVWRSRAIVKEGSVEIKKEAVSARELREARGRIQKNRSTKHCFDDSVL